MRFIALLLPLFLWSVPNPEGRPSKAPFISGDAFRAYSDYCYDEVDSTLDPRTVRPGSTLFVKTDYLQEFFESIHPLIPHPYILIAHNSDAPTPGPFAPYLDEEKLIAWFGQNYDGYQHPKMHPIPMGIPNYCWSPRNDEILLETKEQRLPKWHLAHMNFSVGNFPEEREFVVQKFSRARYCFHPPQKPFRRYIADVASSKFELAPRGHALDTHRIWESLYVGTIPVVKTSSLDSLYADLPILIVDNWEQVDERYLREKYQPFDVDSLDKLSMDYWTRRIDQFKE